MVCGHNLPADAVFSKCKNALEDGHRYENFAWRLWYRETHKDVSAALSEPEVPSDESASESASSTDARGSSEIDNLANAFAPLIRSPPYEQRWAEELVGLAREAQSRRSVSSPSEDESTGSTAATGLSMTQLPDIQATEVKETVSPAETPRGIGTPHSTSSTVTPFGCSRANSVCVSLDGTATLSAQPTPSASPPNRPATSAAPPSPAPMSAIEETPVAKPQNDARVIRKSSSAALGRRRRGNKSAEALGRLGGKNPSRTQIMQMLSMTKDTKPKKKNKDKIKFTMGSESDEEESAPSAQHNDDDEWSSDEADEEEEAKQREAAAAAERARRAAERERERLEMFKKRPIRSVSLADLAATKPAEDERQRGLLSCIFHEERAQQQPSRTESSAGKIGPMRSLPGRRLRSTHMLALDEEAPPSPTTVTFTAMARPQNQRSSSGSNLAVNRSKSAVALPMLNLTSLQSSTAVARMPEDSTSERDVVQPPERRQSALESTKSYMALARLSALAQRGSTDHTTSMNCAASQTSLASSEPSNESEEGPSLAVLPGNDALACVKRDPEEEEQAKQPSTSTLTDSAPLPSLTTMMARQDMLRSELSASLRQNLQWERQSRTRSMGLAAARANHARRNLSPTTHDSEDESFHHKGW